MSIGYQEDVLYYEGSERVQNIVQRGGDNPICGDIQGQTWWETLNVFLLTVGRLDKIAFEGPFYPYAFSVTIHRQWESLAADTIP